MIEEDDESGDAVITVSYTADSEKACNYFNKLILENVDHISSWREVNEKPIMVGEEQMGSYWSGFVNLTVFAEQVEPALTAIQALRVAPGNEGLHPTVKTTVLALGEKTVEQAQIAFLLDKVQDQERMIDVLTSNCGRLIEMNGVNQQAIAAMAKKYSTLQTYLTEVIDLTGLMKAVREIAEQVDEDILDEHKMVRVH